MHILIRSHTHTHTHTKTHIPSHIHFRPLSHIHILVCTFSRELADFTVYVLLYASSYTCPLIYTPSHILTYSHTHTHSYTYLHTFSHIRTLTSTTSHTHIHPLIHNLSQTYPLIYISHMPPLTYPFSYTSSHTCFSRTPFLVYSQICD